MRKKQRGMSLFGVMFVGLAIVTGALLVMKLIPPYLEFMSIQKVLTVMSKDSSLQGMSPNEVMASFDRRAVIDNITVIKGKDLEIAKQGGKVVVKAKYSVKEPLVGNLSALMEFEDSTK